MRFLIPAVCIPATMVLSGVTIEHWQFWAMLGILCVFQLSFGLSEYSRGFSNGLHYTQNYWSSHK